MAAQSPAPVQGPVTGEQQTRPRPTQAGPSTASIPVIRPPVQVRRPDADPASATAETRSLRVTPPDAKAMYRTPTGPANAVPPAPVPAPPRPVTPKAPGAGDGGADTARTRRVVVIPATAPSAETAAPGTATWTSTSTPAGMTSTTSASASPPPAAREPGPVRPSGTAAPSDRTQRADARAQLHPSDAGTADWLGELRGDDAASASGESSPAQLWGRGFSADQAAASTIVPTRGRAAKRQRRAAEKARKAEATATIKSMRRAKGSDPSPAPPPPPPPPPQEAVPPPLPVPPAFEADAQYAELDDLEENDRSRWVSMLVFWAPALILLLLAGLVIWLVR
jgi:hypothetical protein